MTKEEMKQALARINGTELEASVDFDWDNAGLKAGEALANGIASAMDAGDKALNFCDALWTGFKYARAKRAGLITE